MKVAVISDVHANLAALEAVLAATDAAGTDELWCLGDLTGYGADPARCTQIVLERADVCLAGNHDMVITGEIGLEAFSSDARTAAEWTMEVLAADDLERLRRLEPKGERQSGSSVMVFTPGWASGYCFTRRPIKTSRSCVAPARLTPGRSRPSTLR